MKKNKIKYQKVVEWEKKPRYDDIVGGFILSLCSLGMLRLVSKNTSEVLTSLGIMTLTFIFALLLIYGIRIMFKGKGKGKKEYYIKKEIK
jgi:TM2 domain-containing membrane protein YozV